MAEAGVYSQAVVVMATLVSMVTSMALPGTKEDTDINLFMPGVQPQNVSTLICVTLCACVQVYVHAFCFHDCDCKLWVCAGMRACEYLQ